MDLHKNARRTDRKSFLKRIAPLGRDTALVLLGVFALGSNSASAQQGPIFNKLVGSWLASYDIPAFGGSISLLLSFTSDGVVIETDTPTTANISGVAVAVGNGQGAWKRTGNRSYAFSYIKELYPPSGGRATPVGHDQTNGTITVSEDGTQLQITNLVLNFFDANGNPILINSGTATANRIVPSASD